MQVSVCHQCLTYSLDILGMLVSQSNNLTGLSDFPPSKRAETCSPLVPPPSQPFWLYLFLLMLDIEQKVVDSVLNFFFACLKTINCKKIIFKHAGKSFAWLTYWLYVQQNYLRMFIKRDEPNIRPPASFLIVLIGY